MNFSIVEGERVNWDDIITDFEQDYIYSTELKNREIQQKYNLTIGEFNELTRFLKEKHGLKRRLTSPMKYGKYYCQNKLGTYNVVKLINNHTVYFGCVPTRDIAEKVVELCKKVEWDIDASKDIVHNYERYIEL